jgi:cell division protein FtsN
MARRRQNTRRSDPAPGWIWMLFGLGLGLLVAIGVYLRAPIAPTSAVTSTSAAAAAPQEKKEQLAPKPAAPQPTSADADADDKRFQFYDILPQFEVVVPRQDARAPAQHAPPVEQPGRYLLQAGSFSEAAEAERLRAMLALRGIVSRVQQATVDGRVFYRVQIGPIDDLDALNRMRRQLLDAGTEPLPLKLRD